MNTQDRIKALATEYGVSSSAAPFTTGNLHRAMDALDRAAKIDSTGGEIYNPFYGRRPKFTVGARLALHEAARREAKRHYFHLGAEAENTGESCCCSCHILNGY